MATVRIRFDGDQVGPKFQRNMAIAGSRVQRSLLGAAQDFIREFKNQEGDQ